MRQFLLSLVLVTISICVVSAQVVDATYKNIQPKDNSPLSRLGFGNILPQYYSANEIGMQFVRLLSNFQS